MRSSAREIVFEYIFSRLFNLNDEGLFDILSEKLNNDDKDFANKLLQNILENYNQYLSDIERLSKGYKLDRLFNPDKCALLIGFAELNLFKNTDIPIIIDEAVKLSSKFSTEKSTDFVNGILAEYSKQVR